jgi:hypothetical protein
MDIVYFNSLIEKDIKIIQNDYKLYYSEILFNENKLFLTGYININLADMQHKKINDIMQEISNIYSEIIFNVDVEKRELHFIDKSFYNFIEESSINKIIFDEKELSNYIYIKFIEDFIFNVLKLTIKHNSINMKDSNIIESFYICEKNESKNITLSNYFENDYLKCKLKKFYDFSFNLKKKGYQFIENKFIK